MASKHTNDLPRGVGHRSRDINKPEGRPVDAGLKKGLQQFRQVHVLNSDALHAAVEPGSLSNAHAFENAPCCGSHLAARIGEPNPGIIWKGLLHRLHDLAEAACILQPVELQRLKRGDITDLAQAFGHILIQAISNGSSNLEKGVTSHVGCLTARQQGRSSCGSPDDEKADGSSKQSNLAL